MKSKTILTTALSVLLAWQFQIAATGVASAQSPFRDRQPTPEEANAKAARADRAQKLLDRGDPDKPRRPKFDVLEEVRALKALPATKETPPPCLGGCAPCLPPSTPRPSR